MLHAANISAREQRQQHERAYDPPDAIEWFLARETAKLKGEPYPYGTDFLSEAERRAGDWSDYREKERRREADRRVEGPGPMNRYEWIANRAYHLWEKAGRSSGSDLDFWLAAENEHDHCQRARSDYREKEPRREEERQQEDRPQYGLRELLASDTESIGHREHEHGS